MNYLKTSRSVTCDWRDLLCLQEGDSVPQTPQVKASSLRDGCSFSDPLSFSEKDHPRLVRPASTPVLPAGILKKACSAALFEVRIKKDQFEFLYEIAAEAGNITFSLLWLKSEVFFTYLTGFWLLVGVHPDLHESLNFQTTVSSCRCKVHLLKLL